MADEERALMSGSTKTMGVMTVGALVAVTAYTVALGSNGWLWFGWVVLGLATLGVLATQDT
ncbi:hypothetical protein A6A29_05945 [Streptomyces sp. TSRI0281]|nr:hypothetical protein A6A29_05945 [Streptomyces sp. TSRI0281]